MKQSFAFAAMVTACAALAQPRPSARGKESHDGHQAKMGGWAPSLVTRRDTKGIEKTLKAWHEAFMKKDINSAAEYLDFPVLMVTDDGKGNVATITWDKATWVKTMTRSMATMPAMKPGQKFPMPKERYELIANDIASVFSSLTMRMGTKLVTTHSHVLVVKRGGKWLVKEMAEGGWAGMVGGGEEAQQ